MIETVQKTQREQSEDTMELYLKHVQSIEYLAATNTRVVIFITAIHTVFVQCMYFLWRWSSERFKYSCAVAEELRASLSVDKGTVVKDR